MARGAGSGEAAVTSLQRVSGKRVEVHRLGLSPYHGPGFLQDERRRLEAIPGVRYLERLQGESPAILVTNTGTRFDALPPHLLAGCRLLLHPNSGYDNLPLELVRRRDLDVVVGNPIRAQAVASCVVAWILQHFHASPHGPRWQGGRRWDRRPLDQIRVLILGYGHIGRIVARSLRPLVRDLAVHDPFRGRGLADLGEAAARCDVLVPLASLNPTSRHLVSEALLRRLPEDFVLVNAARGDLVDQAALIAVLRERPGACAYLDVFRDEPFDPEEFAGLPNVRLSSHVAGVFRGLDERILEFEARVVRDFLGLDRAGFRRAYGALLLRRRLRGDFLV
jgi:D-3-phosphoglycerate dehydrogenase